MFWVYVLENPDGKLYTGQTASLRERTPHVLDLQDAVPREREAAGNFLVALPVEITLDA